MGWLYQRTLRDGRKSTIWWCKYYVDGRPIRESTGTTDPRKAGKVLDQREARVTVGLPVMPRAEKIRVAELFEDLRHEYRVNGRRSADRLEFSLGHLVPVFGLRAAHSLTAADVNAYIAGRLKAGASPATVNREQAALRRAFRLGLAHEKIHRAPPIRALLEHNVRTGFFERAGFEAVRRHLPEALRGVVTFAYVTGWRVPSEILLLQWRQIDLLAGTVRLEPGTTKNAEGRMFVMTPELRATLEAQRAETDAAQRKGGAIIPWVFHRGGRPIRDFRGAWKTACKAAGLPGRIPHDFRRTAVRNLERAGVARSVAMRMVGHKTEAVYRRYAIVSEGDLHEAAQKLAALGAGTSWGTSWGVAQETRPASS